MALRIPFSLMKPNTYWIKAQSILIIGTGQSGMLKLSDEAEKYFKENKCSVELLSTPQAVKFWNEAKGKTIGMFHVTC